MLKKSVFFVLSLFLLLQNLFADTTNVPAYYTNALQQKTIVPQTIYNQLQTALALYQTAAAHPWPLIPNSARFKLGNSNPNVLILRDHLTLTGDLASDNNSTLFDSTLQQAIKNFQERHGLNADGVVGKKTRAELNITPQERIKQIEINMQRWAALSPKLGHRYIMVNVPDFHLYLIDDDKEVLRMKIIVGKPTRQTPELASRITTLVFKPYWNVPEKIARNDIATKAMADPDYLDKNNIHAYNNEDKTDEVDQDDIDWHDVQQNGSEYSFRQDPGTNNSLGLVKFEFPNTYDVYLHDTPAKNLFSEEIRDFSSGCIRLEKPFDLVNYLMKDDPTWNQDRLQTALDEDRPTYVSISKPIPVIITYITAWVDDKGKINFRNDIYNRDL